MFVMFKITLILLCLTTLVIGASAEEETCSLKPDKGRCRSLLVRWYFSRGSQKCHRFIYGGCVGNANNFDSEEDCRRKCLPEKSSEEICNLPKNTGPCRAFFIRYWYNNVTQKCEDFVFGGCNENANNFVKPEDCLQTCKATGLTTQFNKSSVVPRQKRSSSSTSLPDSCLQPMRPGFGNRNYKRFWFNSKTKRCEEFTFGGVRGNANNFVSLTRCEKHCNPKKLRN